MKPMVLRFFNLWLAFFRNSLSRNMEYKMNFILDLFIDATFYGSYFFFFSIIFSYVDALGDFSRDAVIIFLIITYLTDSVFVFFFGSNTFQINRMVVRGDLDLILLKPVNSLFFVSFRYIATYSIISTILLSGLLLRMTSIYPEPIGLLNYIAFLISFCLGILILYSLELVVSCLVFWYKNFSVGGWLCNELTKYSRRPDSIYSGVLRKLLFSFFPMAMISSFPARILIFGPDFYMLLTQVFITALSLLLTVFVWNRGLIRYDSASS